MQIVFEKISQHISEPNLDTQADFSMLVTTLEADNFLGRILTGRVESGTVKVGDNLQALNLETGLVEKARIAKLLMCKGLEKINVNTASAGDIVSIAGFTKATVADTICSEKISTPLEALPITPPTMSMTVSVNDSPLVGRDGDKLTGNMIAERLYKEYLDDIEEYNNTGNEEEIIKAQNYYCEHQQQNPHTPRVMLTLGLPEEDVKTFCTDNLFPKT